MLDDYPAFKHALANPPRRVIPLPESRRFLTSEADDPCMSFGDWIRSLHPWHFRAFFEHLVRLAISEIRRAVGRIADLDAGTPSGRPTPSRHRLTKSQLERMAACDPTWLLDHCRTVFDTLETAEKVFGTGGYHQIYISQNSLPGRLEIEAWGAIVRRLRNIPLAARERVESWCNDLQEILEFYEEGLAYEAPASWHPSQPDTSWLTPNRSNQWARSFQGFVTDLATVLRISCPALVAGFCEAYPVIAGLTPMRGLPLVVHPSRPQT